ncbi:double zinc ribbon domain-containing protein [Roseovarius sp. SCSIO 43702]|uniref:ComF family protein n=1 Tax=Roseovarius sp. SCSIO 43702 TaxID=2823043 RepID=UPI001C738DE5|nr:double zinc ribbon domain-containing protein [Roseovarius sp. SCSIO 43702]QYX57023.1 double zinc ribbon domain-containing protein [Roseovarius sp. SCSIO 43702]
MNAGVVQSVLRLVYPPRCLTCGEEVASDFGLCGPCWRETPFVTGLCCDACGIGLPTGPDMPNEIRCDDCLTQGRPWSKGRSAMAYSGNGRKIVLALKHGDRHDVVRPAGAWLARAAAPLVLPRMIVAPVPLHWMRMIKRRFNQSALLARALAAEAGLDLGPDLLIRPRATESLGGLGYEMRHRTMQNAITAHPRRGADMAGRPVLLVDDVMTSGATLSVAAQACLAAGASDVRIVTLARAGKDA